MTFEVRTVHDFLGLGRSRSTTTVLRRGPGAPVLGQRWEESKLKDKNYNVRTKVRHMELPRVHQDARAPGCWAPRTTPPYTSRGRLRLV